MLKEDKAEYIQALIDARENENAEIFYDCMARLHAQHLRHDIDQFEASMNKKMVDKSKIQEKMADKWSIKPSLAAKLADILAFASSKDEITTSSVMQQFGFTATTAKRYLRHLTDFGYLEPSGGNKNRVYRVTAK